VLLVRHVYGLSKDAGDLFFRKSDNRCIHLSISFLVVCKGYVIEWVLSFVNPHNHSISLIKTGEFLQSHKTWCFIRNIKR